MNYSDRLPEEADEIGEIPQDLTVPIRKEGASKPKNFEEQCQRVKKVIDEVIERAKKLTGKDRHSDEVIHIFTQDKVYGAMQGLMACRAGFDEQGSRTGKGRPYEGWTREDFEELLEAID